MIEVVIVVQLNLLDISSNSYSIKSARYLTRTMSFLLHKIETGGHTEGFRRHDSHCKLYDQRPSGDRHVTLLVQPNRAFRAFLAGPRCVS